MQQLTNPLDQERFISIVLLVPNVLLWLLHYGNGSDWEPVLFASSCLLAGFAVFIHACAWVADEGKV